MNTIDSIHWSGWFRLVIACGSLFVGDSESFQRRIATDKEAGRPLIAHVVVVLCDNEHQGIARVPTSLGNGQDPKSNLYWGAMYGVRSYLTRNAGWDVVDAKLAAHDGVLDSIVLHTVFEQNAKRVSVFIIAEAWDGRRIREGTARFLELASGLDSERVEIKSKSGRAPIEVGGAAHLVVYVGHNGLMEFAVDHVPTMQTGSAPRSAMVLACWSKQYFLEHLTQGGSFPVLLTTGRMAPEAYIVDAAVRTWFAGKSADQVCEAAGTSYDKFQKCGRLAALRLFTAGK